MESFFELYYLYKSTDDMDDRFIKDPTNKVCKFCQTAYPSVLFNTIPHIIPELFGRNNLTSNFECDTCNQKFQKYESDTSTMIQHYLSLLKIKTKKGVPTFQSNKKAGEYSTILKSQGNSTTLNFGSNLKDFEFNDEDNTLTVSFRTRKYRPFSVYKIFLKMGISLLDDTDLSVNNHYLEFLNSEEPIQDGRQIWKVFRYMVKTKYYEAPKVQLYRAKNTSGENSVFPEFTMILFFANIVFQFFLPISKKNIDEYNPKDDLILQYFPVFVIDDVKRHKDIVFYPFDLNETNKISVTDKLVFKYGKRVTKT